MATLSVVEPQPPGLPDWIEPSLNVTPGLDPLGLQTITQARIMPLLLPGILVLSQRARYFSFHSFLLHEYQRLRLPLSNTDLSEFVKLREFELAVSVQLCPRGCGEISSGAVGTNRASPAAADDPIPRQESVKSFLGGYGLYYRSPMIDLGLVVPRGTQLGDTATPVDVLTPDGLGPELAEAFMSAVEDTDYYREHMLSAEPIPRKVLAEFAEVSCLCRLPDYPAEQAVLRRVLFEAPEPAFEASTEQRRRSFALLLREIEREPAVATSNGAFREAVWGDFAAGFNEQTPQREMLARWSALVAKEYWQESLTSLWSHLLRLGGEHGSDGLAPVELDEVLKRRLLARGQIDVRGTAIAVDPAAPTTVFAEAVAKATADMPLEAIREWVADVDEASAAMTLLFALIAQLPDPTEAGPGWVEIGSCSSEWQPSLLLFMRWLEQHLEDGPTLAETAAWLVRRFVITAHERIAYSKLPEFTFRFRWESGSLHFYSLGLGRFDLANMRREAMARISEDVSLWSDDDGTPQLTAEGRRFVSEVFAA